MQPNGEERKALRYFMWVNLAGGIGACILLTLLFILSDSPSSRPIVLTAVFAVVFVVIGILAWRRGLLTRRG